MAKAAVKHWIVKQEPDAYSFDAFVADGTTEWTGIRNYQARNFLRAMSIGDKVLYYHSQVGKCVVGTALVSRAAFPDPTAKEGDWSAVELKAGKTLPHPVTLDELKADPLVANILLVRHSRISVSPLEAAEFQRILDMGGLKKF